MDKFLIAVAAGGLNYVTRQLIDTDRDDPDTRALMRQVMEEVVFVANAKDILLSKSHIVAQMNFLEKLPHDAKMSVAVDLERGNRLELPWLFGAFTQMGGELGISTPANSFIYAPLKHYIDGINSLKAELLAEDII